MKKYYIYHISGVKVGVTTKIKHREYLYRKQGKNYKLEVLEVIESEDYEEIGNREWEWADKLGYPRGTHYRNVKFKYHGKDSHAKRGLILNGTAIDHPK